MADVTKDLLIKISSEGGDDVTADLDKTGTSLDSMAMRLTGINSAWDLFSKVLGVAKTGLGYARDAFESMINTASTFEQLGIRMETIFGGGGPAQAALDWANKFAATTPLTLQDVTEKMIRLKAYGFDPMNGMLETLANASYAVGTDFNGIVLALGQMALKGHVVQQELNQLSERNIPAIQWLKEELGLTAAQMGDIGNQAISSDKAIEIILRRMNEEYGGALKKAGDTWAGSISTIQDIFMIFQKNIMNQGPWEFLLTNIRAIRDAFSAWAQSVDGANFAFAAGGAITKQLEFWKNFINQNLLPNMETFYQLGLDIYKTFGLIWNTFVDIAGTIAVPIMLGLAEIFGITGEWANSVNGVMELFSTLRRELIPRIIEGFGFVVVAVQELWVKIVDGAIWATTGIATAFGNVIKQIASAFKEIGEQAFVGGAVFTSIGGLMEKAGNWIVADSKAFKEKSLLDSQAAYAGLAVQRDFFKDWANGTRTDINKWGGVIDSMKVNLADPLKSLSNSGEEARLVWEKGVNERTKGKTLFDLETGVGLNKVTDKFGNQKYEDSQKAVMEQPKPSNALQLVAPPGDDMLTIIIKYLNSALRAEGTVGAGF